MSPIRWELPPRRSQAMVSPAATWTSPSSRLRCGALIAYCAGSRAVYGRALGLPAAGRRPARSIDPARTLRAVLLPEGPLVARGAAEGIVVVFSSVGITRPKKWCDL